MGTKMTQFHAGQVEIDHLDAIGQVDAESVAGIQAAVRQQIGQALRTRVKFAEREAAVLEFKRHGIAASYERKVEEVVQVHADRSSDKVAGLCRVGFQNSRCPPNRIALQPLGRRIEAEPPGQCFIADALPAHNLAPPPPGSGRALCQMPERR